MYNIQKRVEEDKYTREEVHSSKTQYMIKDAITAHERKITTDIRKKQGA